MNTIILSALATAATSVALMLPAMLYANTDASLTARWAVGLWGTTAAAALWYAAIISVK